MAEGSNLGEQYIGQIHSGTFTIHTNTVYFNNYQNSGSDILKSRPEVNRKIKRTERTGNQLLSESRNQRCRKRRKKRIGLSKGLIRAINKTVENPEQLINYLNEVRRKKDKRLMEITYKYTEKIALLIKVLQNVENKYTAISKGKAGKKLENDDLLFLANLRKRLRKLFLSTGNGLFSSESESD